jgi:hypothetical protein
MYDTKFECRYHKDDVFLETDQLSENQKFLIRDILYKEDLLNIFLIDYYDDNYDVFTEIIPKLYSKIKECVTLTKCMKKMAEKLMSEDPELGLCILYSYDYMYITHKCVSEYLDNGSISEENMNLLEQICIKLPNNIL